MFNKKAGNEPEDSRGKPMTSHTPSTPSPTHDSGASPSPAGAGGAATVLAEGSKFTGKADVTGTFRIEGKAEGNLKAAESLVVGKTGDVKADVKTRRAVLNGKFRGKIEASDRVELQAGSDVEADLNAKNMVMEDGVSFRGNLKIGG